MTSELSRVDEARRSKIVHGLDLALKTGLEVGPLCRPFIRESDGAIIYADYMTNAELREKYAADPHVEVDNLASMSVLWRSNRLCDALFQGTGISMVDYVVASHVVEHVPNLVGWLKQIEDVLEDGGELRLVVPDKRYTFDYFRQESRLSDVLLSHLVDAKVPQPHCVLDFALNASHVTATDAWKGTVHNAPRYHTVSGAVDLARDILQNGSYHDVHCWAFTPRSFASIMKSLAKERLIGFACEGFHDTAQDEIEFFVSMRKSAQPSDGWDNMERTCGVS